MKKIFALFLFLCMCVTTVLAAGSAGLNYKVMSAGGVTPARTESGRTVLATGVSSEINYNWGSGTVMGTGWSDSVIIHWTGYIKWPGTTGNKTINFYSASDDGFSVSINGVSVIESWREQGTSWYNGSGSITLTAGQIYYVDAWFYENGGGAAAYWYWDTGAGITLVPSTNLATDATYWAPTVVGGTITQTNAPTSQVITSGATSTAGITQSQQTRVNAWNNKTLNNNLIYIEQIGNNNSITVTQTGNKNLITGIGQQAGSINGDQNAVTVNQGVAGIGQNEIDLRVVGSSNTVNIGQARNSAGTAVGGNGHYQSFDMFGSNNTVVTQQSNSGGAGSHYMETTITGNSNTVTNKQLDNGNKIMFGTVNNGSNNTATATQQGTGTHYLDYKLTGNGNGLNVNQFGSSQNKATIDLVNGGGPASLSLTQSGGQNFSISQTCAVAAGCSTTVIQQP